MPSKPPTPGPNVAAEAPRTAAGRALAGWVRPNLRGAWAAAIGAIEAEAERTALTSFRDRIAGSSSPASEELLALIDQALAERAAHPDG